MPLGMRERASEALRSAANAAQVKADEAGITAHIEEYKQEARDKERKKGKEELPSSSSSSLLHGQKDGSSRLGDRHHDDHQEGPGDSESEDQNLSDPSHGSKRPSSIPQISTTDLRPGVDVTPATPVSPISSAKTIKPTRQLQQQLYRRRSSREGDSASEDDAISSHQRPLMRSPGSEASEDDDNNGVLGLVLDEPGRMSEEQEQRLLDREQEEKRKAREYALHHPDKGEDRPDMPPPSSRQNLNSRHPRLGRALEHVKIPPKPSVLQRLPSQAIADSPTDEAASTPSGSEPGSRGPSSPGGLLSQFNSIAPLTSRDGQDSSGLPSSERHPHFSNASSHLPGLVAHAVNNLHQKIAKPNDYRFPHMDTEGKARQSDSDISKRTTSDASRSNTLDSIASSSGYDSTPSSSFLEAQNQAGSPRSEDVSSGGPSPSSVNEYSTPTGFLKHRRSSSQNAPREVKETYNAGYKDLPDGKRKLNQYILLSDIGKGSFGTVWLAKDEQTEVEYAAKEFSKMRLRKRAQSEMIRRQAKGSRRGAVPIRRQGNSQRLGPGDNKNDLDLIRSEIAIMKKLDHPNVLRLFEVLDVEQDDPLFMVVELCKKGPVMNVGMGQHARPMSEDEARNYFRQMILAIEYLHENGIIHRDIKPENILRSDDDIIKIVDFGVSEMFSREEQSDHRELRTGGSPAFMAPELCMSGKTQVSGKAADIWALGVTLYCMVVGHLPFESHNMLDLYDSIKNDPINMPEGLSYDIKDLILLLLDKNFHTRIRMSALREHKWVTRDGRDPLPSTDANVSSLPEVTEHDVDNAIGVPSVSYIVNAVRAASRWRRFAARRTQSEGARSDTASSVSTDMSRAGSFDLEEARKPSNSSGLSQQVSSEPGLPTVVSSPEQTQAEFPQTAAPPHSDAEDYVQGGPSSNKIRNRAKVSEDTPLKQASSYPGATTKLGEKVPRSQLGSSDPTPEGSTARSHKTSMDSMVDFPEIDRCASQQEYLASTGIDDSSVEMLRYYEDTTGHMLPRSAVDEVLQLRKTSPLPPTPEQKNEASDTKD